MFKTLALRYHDKGRSHKVSVVSLDIPTASVPVCEMRREDCFCFFKNIKIGTASNLRMKGLEDSWC